MGNKQSHGKRNGVEPTNDENRPPVPELPPALPAVPAPVPTPPAPPSPPVIEMADVIVSAISALEANAPPAPPIPDVPAAPPAALVPPAPVVTVRLPAMSPSATHFLHGRPAVRTLFSPVTSRKSQVCMAAGGRAGQGVDEGGHHEERLPHVLRPSRSNSSTGRPSGSSRDELYPKIAAA